MIVNPAGTDCCQRCGRCTNDPERPVLLLAIRDERLCSACWKRLGRPWPVDGPRLSEKELFEREQAIRRGQLEEGGAQAYRVRAGKT